MGADNIGEKRNGVLDLLKVAATFCIIMHHYQQRMGWDGIFWNDTHFYFGYLVELFFLISGIVIFPEIDKIRKGKTLKEFFGKRYLRFLPAVALSVICYELLLVIYRSCVGMDFTGSEINWGGTLVAALGFQSWVFPNPMINNPVWYISVLLLCSLILYIIVRISERFPDWKTEYSYVVMILLGCAVVTNEWELPLLNQNTGRGFYAFFTGVLLYELMTKWKTRSRYILSGLITAGITLALVFLPDITQAGIVSWYGINLVFVFLYYPAILLFLDNDPLRSLLGRPWLSGLARISLGAFIWHHVIHTAFVMYMVISGQYYNVSAPVIVGLVVCTDYLAGVLSWFLFEKLFRQLSRKWTGGSGEEEKS